MRFLSLQSGSNGNSLYVEAGGLRLLFDAGISGAQLEARLFLRGVEAEGIDALFISHEHADHIRSAGILSRQLRIPVFISEPTLQAAQRRFRLGNIAEICHFLPGVAINMGYGVTVHTIATPHDSVDGAIFVVDDGVHKLGICTDVGHVYEGLRSVAGNVDALYLESNYDEEMLANGPYHAALKRRIHGPGGHISNAAAAELVAGYASPRLQWLCIGHLSEENNDPMLALTTHRAILGDKFPVHLASRYAVSEWFDTSPPPSGPRGPLVATPRRPGELGLVEEFFARPSMIWQRKRDLFS